MVKKSYFKILHRMFRSNTIRLISVILIITIGIAVSAGIGSLAPRMREAVRIMEAGGDDAMHILQVSSLADSIEIISFVFPVFFIMVSALVVFITITRLADEERSQVGCFKTLGYPRKSIVLKYMLFALVGCLLGTTFGLLLGELVISPILYSAAIAHLTIPEVTGVYLGFGLVAAAVMIVSVLGITFLVTYKMAKERPANLLKHKTPKEGKKTIMERIPFIWNGLPFRYKSTLRNLFRYKGRFFMTVLSVMGITLLIFCGNSLYFALVETNDFMIDLIIPICVVLIICAVALGILVMYNLTNINIEERKREIATLKVLGYKNIEVSGYIFREIFILSVVGIALGLPLGFLVFRYVLNSLKFGDPDALEWYVWVISAAIALLTTLITDLLLFRKIHKMDMLSSLKTVE